jgi:protein-tyrosine phosphatase
MAEGLLRAGLSPRLMERVTVASAGTHAIHGNLPSALAVQALQAWGVDIAGHRARTLTKPMVKQSNLVLTMEKAHLTHIRFMPFLKMKKIRRISEFDETRAPCDIPDPIDGDLEMYRSTAQLLKSCVKGVCAYLENSLET